VRSCFPNKSQECVELRDIMHEKKAPNHTILKHFRIGMINRVIKGVQNRSKLNTNNYIVFQHSIDSNNIIKNPSLNQQNIIINIY
jgi:hypothetical protein